RLWQILPLGHTGYGDSPYQSFSAFAGNPLLISPDILLKKGYIEESDLASHPQFDEHKIKYDRVINFKNELLRKASKNFQKLIKSKEKTAASAKRAYNKFCKENADWLDDYALFISVKNHLIEERQDDLGSSEYKKFRRANLRSLGESRLNDFYYGAFITSWPEGLANRDPDTMKSWAKILKEDIDFYKFCQFEFFEEWIEIKKYANKNHVEIIGDIPIFVSADSADVWANKSLFSLDSKGKMTEVAGVPPDYFSQTGQLWGNPLYNWQAHKKTGYKWWIKRISNLLKLVDIVRIDHFRAFESYWSIPYGSETAINGKWKKGPNKDLFEAIRKELGDLPIIAEDLGDLNKEVGELRDELGLPGMKILQFAFSYEGNDYLPHTYKTSNCVVYTGTHDNDTTLNWYKTLSDKERDYLRRYLNINGEDVCWDMIRLAFSTVADTVIIPLQDVLKLDGSARMNTPGVSTGNWQFRYTSDMLTDESAKGLAYFSKLFNRNN
ncbi:MAG: 4-alpha-glucanotransferase, partial [Firmicutes bacterium]|nr:4-alpha-glucanotransferase [Bacillota bacterium]